MGMSPFPSRHDEPDLVVLATLLELARQIQGEVVQISDDTWAIHGSVPYDGDIIVAEFHELALARELLQLIPPEPAHSAPLPIDSVRSRPAI